MTKQSPNTNDDLTGYWQGSEGPVQINDDKTLSYGGQTYLYATQNNILTIAPLVNASQIPYQQTGDTLTLNVNGQVVALTRQPAGNQTSSSNPPNNPIEGVTSPDSESGSTATNPNPTMKALAGVWVGEEASLDPQYYMRFTRYLILYPDGSVGFDKTEGGASSTQISEYQARFTYFSSGRTGNQNVWGQWVTDGSNVQVHWKNNTAWQGQFDPASGKMLMFGVGVIEEGSNVVFERQ